LKRARIASNGFLLRGVIDHHFLDFKICSPVVLPFINTVSPIVNSFSSIKTVQHLISGKMSAFTKVFFLIFTAFFCNRFAFCQAQLSREAAKGSALF
jgi:hypothetical protein